MALTVDRLTKEAIDAAVIRGMEGARLPGVVAATADISGSRYVGPFGSSRADGQTRMAVDTVFWVASMTKVVTAIAALQLVTAGKIDLHHPVGGILDELTDPSVLNGFDDDGTPILRSTSKSITLHHLLTHTSGITYPIWDADHARYVGRENIPHFSTGALASLKVPLAFEPGEGWGYGLGIDWVGQMVERVSGLNLEDYFNDNIFAPLGMTDTSFYLRDNMRQRLAGMNVRQPDGGLVPIEFALPQYPEFLGGGGGLYTTCDDYLKLMTMILRRGQADGRSIVSSATIDLLVGNQIGDQRVGELRSCAPNFSNSIEFLPGREKRWSYCSLINVEAVEGGRSAGSLFWGGIANTYYWIDIAKGICGVYLAQVLPFADEATLGSFNAFEAVVYQT